VSPDVRGGKRDMEDEDGCMCNREPINITTRQTEMTDGEALTESQSEFESKSKIFNPDDP
jgi:hypothetical protein